MRSLAVRALVVIFIVVDLVADVLQRVGQGGDFGSVDWRTSDSVDKVASDLLRASNSGRCIR